MRLIPRSSRRLSARLVDYTYPELRATGASRVRAGSLGGRSREIRAGVFGNRNPEERR